MFNSTHDSVKPSEKTSSRTLIISDKNCIVCQSQLLTSVWCLRNKVQLLRSILPLTKSSNFHPKCEQQHCNRACHLAADWCHMCLPLQMLRPVDTTRGYTVLLPVSSRVDCQLFSISSKLYSYHIIILYHLSVDTMAEQSLANPLSIS